MSDIADIKAYKAVRITVHVDETENLRMQPLGIKNSPKFYRCWRVRMWDNLITTDP